MLKADEVEQAFIETAEEQTGGPFDWRKLAAKLNERLADQQDAEAGTRPLMLLVK